MDHAARTDFLPELMKFLVWVVIVHFRFFLRIEVVEIAEEFIETVIGWQHVV